MLCLVGKLEGVKPLLKKIFPLPLDKGKGIKGIGSSNKDLRG